MTFNIIRIAHMIEDRIKTLNTIKGATNAIRVLFKKEGIAFVPFGVGNSKTDLPGLYRKVGDTCPSTCPWLGNGCYGEDYHVRLQQVRASNAVDATIASFIATAMLSHKYRNRWPSRILVSGDFYLNDVVDRPLIEALKRASSYLQGFLRQEVISYGYTHGHDKALIEELNTVGIVVLESDYFGPGGAVVYSHDRIDELKAKAEGFTPVKCASQASKHGKTCATCTLCKDAKEKNLCIVFNPHGTNKKKVEMTMSFLLEKLS